MVHDILPALTFDLPTQSVTFIIKVHFILSLHCLFICLFVCCSIFDDAACPKTYQVQLTVVKFNEFHSGRYTVTISNRAGMLTSNFDRSLEG